MKEIVNGIVKSTYVGYEGHGILTAYLEFEHSGGCQSFGGFFPKRLPEFLEGCLKVCGVEEFVKCQGCVLRLRIEDGQIVAIGHPVKDWWFEPRKEFAEGEKA